MKYEICKPAISFFTKNIFINMVSGSHIESKNTQYFLFLIIFFLFLFSNSLSLSIEFNPTNFDLVLFFKIFFAIEPV